MHDLAVVLVSHNGVRWINECLTTLYAHVGDCTVDVVVVSNSDDGTSEFVANEFPQARVIRCENRGFAHANNQGLVTCNARYAFCSTSTRSFLTATSAALVAALDARPSTGAAGIRQVTPRETSPRPSAGSRMPLRALARVWGLRALAVPIPMARRARARRLRIRARTTLRLGLRLLPRPSTRRVGRRRAARRAFLPVQRRAGSLPAAQAGGLGGAVPADPDDPPPRRQHRRRHHASQRKTRTRASSSHKSISRSRSVPPTEHRWLSATSIRSGRPSPAGRPAAARAAFARSSDSAPRPSALRRRFARIEAGCALMTTDPDVSILDRELEHARHHPPLSRPPSVGRRRRSQVRGHCRRQRVARRLGCCAQGSNGHRADRECGKPRIRLRRESGLPALQERSWSCCSTRTWT